MKRRALNGLLCLSLCLLLSSCDDGTNYAPVVDVTQVDPIPKTGVHQVQQGETLYEVAWRYGLDYRDLAASNAVKPPYAIHSGQSVYLRPKQTQATKASVVSSERNKKEPDYKVTKWLRPASGRFLTSFSSAHKGVNIVGVAGEPIYATAPGKVVYCGNGLRGYGNLIIIKHNHLYLSAYAHNQNVFVKEGDWVKKGQKIAEMGHTGTDKVMLHFEIRRAGVAIDPVPLLST